MKWVALTVAAGALGAIGYFAVSALIEKGKAVVSESKTRTAGTQALPSRDEPLEWDTGLPKINDLEGIIGDVIAGVPRQPRSDTPQRRRTYTDSAGHTYSLGGPLTGYGEAP